MEDNINKKAIQSAKWLTVMGILSSVCSFVISTVLGRISPALLGQYTLVLSFLNLTSAIVCMGGSVILSRYMIREEHVVSRTRVFCTYGYLVAAVYVLFAGGLLLCPGLYGMLVGKTTEQIKIYSIIFIMPVYASVVVVSCLLMAVLESRISKIMGNLYVIGMCFVCILLYFVMPDALNLYFYRVVFFVIFITNLAALGMGAAYIRRNHILCFSAESFRPFFYEGMPVFILCAWGQAVLIYLHGNVDKIFLSQLDGLGQLGYYQAILQIAAVVDFVPNLLGNITIPFFSSIIGKQEVGQVKAAYLKIEQLLILFLTTCVFGLIAVTDLLLEVFGKEYAVYKGALLLMLAGKLLSSRGYLNTPMLVNMDKNMIRLLNSVIQVLLQMLMMYFLVLRTGLYGAVAAKTVTSVAAQFLPQYILNKSRYQIGFSRQYITAGVSLCILCGSIILFQPGIVMSIIVSVFCYAGFFLSAGYSASGVLKDIKKLLLG